MATLSDYHYKRMLHEEMQREQYKLQSQFERTAIEAYYAQMMIRGGFSPGMVVNSNGTVIGVDRGEEYKSEKNNGEQEKLKNLIAYYYTSR